jgi:hypothetical protein
MGQLGNKSFLNFENLVPHVLLLVAGRILETDLRKNLVMNLSNSE